MDTNQLQQQVECPVCMEQFRTPKQLPCQHSFCLHCLQNVHNIEGGQRVRCPECRQEHQIPESGIAGFPTSVTIQRLIEAMNQPNIPQLHPSAPPLTVRNTVVPAVSTINQVRADDDNLVMVRAISLVEHQQQLERENLGQQQREQQQRDQQRRDQQRRDQQRRDQQRRNQQQRDQQQRDQQQRDQQQRDQRLRDQQRRDQQRRNQQQRDQQQRDQQQRDQQQRDQQQRDQQQRDQQQRVQAGNQVAPQISVPDNTWRITFLKLFFLPIVLIITFSRFIAGAVKLGSDCHDEYNVAVYTFVKAWFGFLLYGSLCVLYGTSNIERAVNNKFVQIWLVIHALFTVIWFFIGTAWVFGKYAEMKTECPKYVEDWNFHFINFILILTVVDWIGAVIFVFYSLYYLCDTDDNNDVQ